MSTQNDKMVMGMVDLSNVGDDAKLYIRILFEKNQRLEKENKELKEAVGVGMVGNEERKFFIQNTGELEKENQELKEKFEWRNRCWTCGEAQGIHRVHQGDDAMGGGEYAYYCDDCVE